MESLRKYFLLLAGIVLLNGCAVYAAYGLYKTVTDINETLTRVSGSINRIQRVVEEGKDLNRASQDGRLITTLSEKIPSLIQNEVEIATKEKITELSGALKLSSLAFTKNAEAENLIGAQKAYNDMSATYNQFAGFMNDLSDTVVPPGK